MDKKSATTAGAVAGSAAGWALAGPLGAGALGTAGGALGRYLGTDAPEEVKSSDGTEGDDAEQVG